MFLAWHRHHHWFINHCMLCLGNAQSGLKSSAVEVRNKSAKLSLIPSTSKFVRPHLRGSAPLSMRKFAKLSPTNSAQPSLTPSVPSTSRSSAEEDKSRSVQLSLKLSTRRTVRPPMSKFAAPSMRRSVSSSMTPSMSRNVRLST